MCPKPVKMAGCYQKTQQLKQHMGKYNNSAKLNMDYRTHYHSLIAIGSTKILSCSCILASIMLQEEPPPATPQPTEKRKRKRKPIPWKGSREKTEKVTADVSTYHRLLAYHPSKTFKYSRRNSIPKQVSRNLVRERNKACIMPKYAIRNASLL